MKYVGKKAEDVKIAYIGGGSQDPRRGKEYKASDAFQRSEHSGLPSLFR